MQRTLANPGVFRAHVWKTTFSLLLDGVCFKVGAVIKFLGIYCLKGAFAFLVMAFPAWAIGFSVYAFMIPRALHSGYILTLVFWQELMSPFLSLSSGVFSDACLCVFSSLVLQKLIF